MRPNQARTALEFQAPHATQRIQGTIRVRATSRGFYDNHVKEKGDVFTIRNKKDLGSWMERLPDEEPAKEIETGKPKDDPKGAKSANDVL